MTVTAIVFVTYCAGNISGPQTFISTEAKQSVPFLPSLRPPTNHVIRGYPTAFKAILICYGLVILVSGALRIYLIWVNKKRDRVEGPAAAAQAQVAPEKRELTAVDYEDITDLKTVGFRYRM